MYGTVSVRLSVRLSQHGPTAANPLLQVCCCRPEATDCCTAGALQQRAAGECGQCDVVGVRKKLNTDLFWRVVERRVLRLCVRERDLWNHLRSWIWRLTDSKLDLA